MMRKSIVLLGLVGSLAGAGCKGETVVKDKPETLQALDVAQKTLDEKNKLIAALQAENARCQGSGSGEIVVAIEGNLMTVKSGGAGSGTPTPRIDDKAAAAAATEFQNLVQKSRGAIQKCYEGALKKNSAIQGRTITMSVSATFSDQGAYKNSNFSAPVNLGDVFDTCIKSVAAKWQMPQNSPAMTFKATVSLTPS
jgi:hypothetical protein